MQHCGELSLIHHHCINDTAAGEEAAAAAAAANPSAPASQHHTRHFYLFVDLRCSTAPRQREERRASVPSAASLDAEMLMTHIARVGEGAAAFVGVGRLCWSLYGKITIFKCRRLQKWARDVTAIRFLGQNTGRDELGRFDIYGSFSALSPYLLGANVTDAFSAGASASRARFA